MIIDSRASEMNAVMDTASAMLAAARTAPKASGVDRLRTAIVTGEDLYRLAGEMRELGEKFGVGFMLRDAGNIEQCDAVVLIGTIESCHGLNEACSYCHHKNCKECADNNGVCVYPPIDLGIAVGSAVSVAADRRIDNRVMFSVGKAALALGMLDEDTKIILGIPLKVSGKSPYFDRKPKA